MSKICSVLEKQTIFVGDHNLTVLSIQRPGFCLVELDNGDRFGLSWDRTFEIWPEVFVGVDRRSSQGKRIKVVIAAPKSVNIWWQDDAEIT